MDPEDFLTGIFGCIKRDKTSIRETVAKEMSSILDHGGFYKSDWISGPCLLGDVWRDSFDEKNREIIKDEEKSISAVFRGKIYNKIDLCEKFNLSPSLNDAKVVISLYDRNIPCFPKFFNGLSSFAIYDYEKDRLVIGNDRYGVYTVFYTLSCDRFLFSPEIKAILKYDGDRVRLNKEAVPEFFTMNFLLGEKTFFEGIKRMPSSGLLTYDREKDKIWLERYWDFPAKPEKFNRNISIGFLLDEFGKIMKRSIGRRVEDTDEIGVFLSGGIDSRIVAAFASEINKNVITFTFGVDDCIQKEIAKRVSDKLGIENIFYEIHTDFISKYAEEIVYHGDGAVRIRDCHFTSNLKKVRKKVKVVLMGTFGYLFGLWNSKEYHEIKNKKEAVNKIYSDWVKLASKFPVEEHLKAFTGEFYKEVEGKLWKNYVSLLEDVEFDSGLDFASYVIYRYFDPNYLQYNNTNPINWHLETRHPFLDKDFFDFFAFRIPLQLYPNKGFLHKAINHFFPSLSDIPLEQGFPPDPPLLMKLIGKSQISFKYSIKRALEKLSKGRLTLPLDYRDYGHWLRTGSRDYVLNLLLDQKTLNRGIFKMNFIKKIVKEHMNGEKNHDRLICDLINFELMNRMFIDK